MKFPTLHTSRADSFLPALLDRLHGLRFRFPRRSRPEDEPVHIETPAPELVSSFRAYSKWASIVGIAIGYHLLIGWMFNIPVLKSPSSDFASTSISAAVCSIFAGIALYLMQTTREPIANRKNFLIQSCAVVVGLICLLTLLGYMFDFDFGLNQVISALGTNESPTEVGTGPAGWMAPITAISFILITLALMFHVRFETYRLTETFSLAAAATSLLALAAYIYQAGTFQGQLPLYGATVVWFISSGILCAHADRGFMAKITSNSFGGIMARRLLPATLIIPIVLGWLQHFGQRAGLYTTEPGLAFFAVANVVVFVSVVWWGVSSLHRMDTKRRAAEHELKETAAKLARSNADLEQFAYVASHDLKEPLRAISASVQILQDQFGNQLRGEADEVIKHTVDGAVRMQRLIDDLLTYSRLTTREAPFEPTDCAILLDDVLANLETAIKESGAVITSDSLPIVNGDRTQLLQVFQNLVGNGIKYRSERTPRIHLNAQERDSEWLFAVRDNGIGIAPQYADRIFRIFQRLHTRKEYVGTGIGLAVCKKIVDRHGGRIWVESEPEEGSTFFFTLQK